MNATDYFFENTWQLEKPFLIGKEEISHSDLYSSAFHLAKWINEKVGTEQHIILLSHNNLFFLKVYLAIIKSGNICIPLDPGIEKENYRYIHDLTDPRLTERSPTIHIKCRSLASVHNLSPVTSSAQDDSISELLRFL